MSIFRAYDIRGRAGTEITVDTARRVGASFGSWAEGGEVALGMDTRITGPFLERACLEGMIGTGCRVHSFGILPISILSYVTQVWGLRGAAYISASHNPPQDNGIRFRSCEGYGLLYQKTDIIKYFQEGSFRLGPGEEIPHDASSAMDEYAEFVKGKVDLEPGLKTVLDMGNGAACKADALYRKLGFDPLVLNGRMDGCFPGRGPAPSDESLMEARKAVLESGAAFGVGFDPDADRGLMIDDQGRILNPEKVAIILARKRYRPGDLVIAGFDCSMVVEDILKEEGYRVERERVGDVFIANRVKESGAVVGVERSAHFFLPEFQYSDDPFAMSLALAEMISEGEALSKLAEEIPDYPYVKIGFSLDSMDKVGKAMKTIEDSLESREPDKLDGVKIVGEDASVLIRASNTSPKIRLYIEARREEQLQELRQEYEPLVRKALKAP